MIRIPTFPREVYFGRASACKVFAPGARYERGVPAVAREKLLTGVDFGATEIRAIVCASTGEPLGLGVAALPWLDSPPGPAAAAEALAAAIAQADAMAGQRTDSFWAALSGTSIRYRLHKETIRIAAADRTVTQADLRRILASARERHVLHWAVASSVLDGRVLWEDPVGEHGSRFEATLILVGAGAERLAEIRGIAAAAGYKVAGFVPGILASAAVLAPAEREIGAAVLDLGASHTTVAIFARGAIKFAAAFNLGGHYVTKDLAVAMGMPLAKAERLKCRLYTQEIEASDLAAKVIQARLRETLEMVRSAIAAAGWENRLPGGYVITGGGSLPESMLGLARECLGGDARLGLPESGHLRGLIGQPAYAVILGLAPVIMQANKSCLEPKGVGRWRSWYRQRHMRT